MIVCDDKGVRITGSTISVIQDFANIIRAVKMTLEDDLSEEATAEIIRICGQLAYSDGKMGSNLALMDEIAQALIDGKL